MILPRLQQHNMAQATTARDLPAPSGTCFGRIGAEVPGFPVSLTRILCHSISARISCRTHTEFESPLDFSYIQIAIKQYGKPFRHRTKRIQRMQNEDASLTLSNYRFANLNGMQTNNE